MELYWKVFERSVRRITPTAMPAGCTDIFLGSEVVLRWKIFTEYIEMIFSPYPHKGSGEGIISLIAKSEKWNYAGRYLQEVLG